MTKKATIGTGIGVGTLLFVLVSTWIQGPATPGDPEVYEQIKRETRCAELAQGMHRTRGDARRRFEGRHQDYLYEVAVSYARAYREQMRQIGC